MNTTNINELFDFALKQENEASAFYEELANKMQNPGVKQIFEELAEDEKGHATLIENYKKDPSLQDRFHKPMHDYKVAETQDMPPLSTDMLPRDAIALAMKREQEAANFYNALAQSAINPLEKGILESLANMELGHKQILENVFVEIGYPEVF